MRLCLRRGRGASTRRPIVAAVAMLTLFAATACGGEDEPAPPTTDPNSPPSTIPVTLTDAGCDPQNFTLPPGVVVFAVTNPSSKKVTEMEIQDLNGHLLGDVEGVGAGTSRSLLIELRPGTYRVRCPEEAPGGGTITVG